MNDTYKLYHDGRFYNTSIDTLEKKQLLDLNDSEQNLKKRFEKILIEKENEIPFVLNDTTFNVTY